jgi:hypothetical protein
MAYTSLFIVDFPLITHFDKIIFTPLYSFQTVKKIDFNENFGNLQRCCGFIAMSSGNHCDVCPESL